MQYLNTFWKTVVSKIPYLNLKQYERKREQLDLLELELNCLKRELERRREQYRQGWSDLLVQERRDRRDRHLLDRLDLLEREIFEKRVLLDLLKPCSPPNPRTPKSSVEIRQQSHIKGWLSKILPEEWLGELEALRYSWLKERKSKLWIKIMTGFCLLGLLKAYLQIKVENRWLPKKKRS